MKHTPKGNSTPIAIGAKFQIPDKDKGISKASVFHFVFRKIFQSHACTFLDPGGIPLEDDVTLGPKVNLITENHPVDPAQRKSLDLKSIRIKRNAWIGAGAAI